MIKFTKMHGLGNDYVYMDAIHQNIENESLLAQFVSNRNFGIGSDGLILICKSDIADFKMRMFNSDGSEAEMCGNGIRCVGKFVYDKGMTDKTEVKSFDVKKYGEVIEIDSKFPNKTNVEFIEILDKDNIKMRVWERGAGETLACGTGACASVVACILNNLTNSKVKVELLGGFLEIEWNQEDNHVYMTGPAVTVFEGELLEKNIK